MSQRRAARAALQAQQKKERGFWSYLLAGISGGLLLIVIGIAAAVIVVPMLTGSVAMTVLTPSMVPIYPPGTLVVVQPVEPEEVRIGDDITYQVASGREEYITHRVIAISRTTTGDLSFTTQGVNNGSPDDPIQAAQVKGRVWYSLPWIGWVNNAVGGGGKTWLVIGLAVVLFAYAGWQFIGGLFDRRSRRPAVAPSSEPSEPPAPPPTA